MKPIYHLAYFLVFGLSSNVCLQAQVQVNPNHPELIFNGGNGIRPNGQPDLAGVLLSQFHRDQLDLDPQQQSQVLKAVRKVGEENFALTQLSIDGNLADLQKALNLASDYLASEIESYLYPTQIVAAQQIGVSEYIRANGITRFAETQLADALKMTPDEIKVLQDKATAIELTLQKKIIELQKQARIDLVNAFPADKRQKLLELFKINGSDSQLKKSGSTSTK